MTVVSLADVRPERVEFLWGEMVPLGHSTIIFGIPGVGKSTVAFALALAASIGCDLLGSKLPASKVLIIDSELTQGVVAGIVQRLAAGFGVVVPETLKYFRAGSGITSKTARAELLEVVESYKPDLVIVDSFTGIACGLDVLNLSEVSGAMSFLSKLAPTTVIVDHVAKQVAGGPRNKSPFGSTAKEILARSLVMVESKQGRLSLVHVKTNFGKLADPLPFRIEHTDEMIRLELDNQSGKDIDATLYERILTALNEPMSPSEIASAIGRKVGTIKNVLTEMKRRNLVTNGARGKWSRTPIVQ